MDGPPPETQPTVDLWPLGWLGTAAVFHITSNTTDVSTVSTETLAVRVCSCCQGRWGWTGNEPRPPLKWSQLDWDCCVSVATPSVTFSSTKLAPTFCFNAFIKPTLLTELPSDKRLLISPVWACRRVRADAETKNKKCPVTSLCSPCSVQATD